MTILSFDGIVYKINEDSVKSDNTVDIIRKLIQEGHLIEYK